MLRETAAAMGAHIAQDDTGRPYTKDEVVQLLALSREQSLPDTPFSPAMLAMAEQHGIDAAQLGNLPAWHAPPLQSTSATVHNGEQDRPPLSFRIISRGEQDGTVRGPGNGRNRAVRESTGEYLCFIDSDDVMMPTRIAKQVCCLFMALCR